MQRKLKDELKLLYAFAIDGGYQGSLEDFKTACEERDKFPPTHTVTKDGVINDRPHQDN